MGRDYGVKYNPPPREREVDFFRSSKESNNSENVTSRRSESFGKNPGKKKKMSDDYNFGHYGDSKKKSSSSRYPWLGGKSKKFSW